MMVSDNAKTFQNIATWLKKIQQNADINTLLAKLDTTWNSISHKDHGGEVSLKEWLVYKRMLSTKQLAGQSYHSTH